MSYGSCQFPTLSFIVERYIANYNFVSKPFFYLELIIGKCNLSWERGKLFDEFIGGVLYEQCMLDPTVTIVKVETKSKKRMKPYPLTTIEFIKLSVSKLKIGSDQAMKIAEKLYSSGYISYPRTETDSFSNKIDLKSILKELEKNGDY